MDYVLLQNVDKDLKYYGVYSTESETFGVSDILCKARQKYYETGAKQHDRGTLKTVYGTFRYIYSIESGTPLKFKKVMGSHQIERVTPTANGYCVETYDNEHHPIKKSYFDNRHDWEKTEFFSASDRSSPIYAVFPSTEGNKPILLCKYKNGRTDTLYPFNISLDKEFTDRLNILTNEPRIFCVTSSGSFYFCTKEEFSVRRNALDKILKQENENTDSQKEKDEEENKAETQNDGSAFVIDSKKLSENKKPIFDLRNSKEILVSDKQTSVERNNAQMYANSDFFTKIEQIAKKNNIDINSVRNTARPSEDEPAKTEKSDIGTSYANTENSFDIREKTFTSFKVDESEKTGPDVKTESKEHSSDYAEKIQNAFKAENQEDGYGEICAFASECPYETVDKQIIEAGGKQYYYFGSLDGSKRSGKGRTVMKNGNTAYEGQYLDDKRDGFGVYYYKSGKLCYTGNWKQNKRDGLGAAFSPNDGSVFVGEWKNDKSVNVGAGFDAAGRLLYAGGVDNGKRNGAGITYNDTDKTFFVGKYKDGEFLGTGTQFDSSGNLLYTGGYNDNKRSGNGTSYKSDGTVEYKGEWLDGKYNGKGKLYLSDGGMIKGSFKDGMANGECTLTDGNGKIIYIGGFSNDIYNGTGRLYSDDGSYAEGRFADGEPTGIFNEYSSDKSLVYCGEWTDMRRSGRGIEYKNDLKIYEGEFDNSLYNGEGKLFKDGEQVYSGSFVNGKRCGLGTEFKKDEVVYFGMWKDDKYNGCGIIYSEGEAKFVGMFSDGMKNGRINEIKNNSVIRKSLYKNDELIYMCEYSFDGSLEYYGGVKNNMRNGMGCSFMSSCEKQFEGIFKNGKHEKSMKVVLKELPILPVCDELKGTEYELYRKTPRYIIERSISNGTVSGIYTGKLKDGMPDGNGTVLYSDHRYTGAFVEGKPDGYGIIYMNDGKEYQGYFSTKPFTGAETVIMTDITYYYSETR